MTAASQLSAQKKADEIQTAIIVVFSVLIALTLLYRGAKCLFAIKSAAEQHYTVVSDRVMRNATVERFELQMAHEKPIRFMAGQLAGYTRNYSLRLVLTPKVADFGLARLVNRADTHVSLSAGRGTPGYAAPEVWLELRMTEKCDVYSFGMLLLKIH